MYGETSGFLRTELTILLQQHRIQQRIGGSGTVTVPVTTTPAQRDQLGHQIRRYRLGVLLWCRQAVAAVNPTIAMRGPGGFRGPAAELHFRLDQTISGTNDGLPPLDELTTAQPFDLVDHWRNAARAAALGEHDFAAEINSGFLDREQCSAVTKDAADVVRSLAVLDRRYSNIPGWKFLSGPTHLEHAANAAAALAAEGATDFTIDRHGWRPPSEPLEGPSRTGVSGVLQAEYNLLVHLQQFPAAINLKRILDSQRELSHLAAARASTSGPAASEKWTARAHTYAALFAETRNIGGLIGDGSQSAAEGAAAISRLRNLDHDQALPSRTLRDLQQVFDRIDARLADVFEHGVRERLYFIKAKVPRIDHHDRNIVHGVRQRFVPITSAVQTDLVGIVRMRLRPSPERPAASPRAAKSREALQQAIEHRPGSNAPGLNF